MRTNDRRILGSMTDFALSCQWIGEEVPSYEDLDMDELETLLARTPMKMLAYATPITAVWKSAAGA